VQLYYYQFATFTFSLRKPYYVVIYQSLEQEYEMPPVNFAILQNKLLIHEQIFTRGNLPFNMQQISASLSETSEYDTISNLSAKC
jgi:hypothetical protein